eukprot:64790-Pyramimonas_sp.AAC.2
MLARRTPGHELKLGLNGSTKILGDTGKDVNREERRTITATVRAQQSDAGLVEDNVSILVT